MGDGYKFRPQGEAGMRKIIKELRTGVDNLRAAHKLFSAVIGAGGITIQDGGSLRIVGANWLLNAAAFDFTVYTVDADGNLAGPFAGMNPGDINVVASDLATGGGINTDVANGCLGIYSLTSKVKIQHLTTAAAANAVLDAGTGILTRSTSSRRYKDDVEDMAPLDLDAVLAMQPKTWRDKLEIEADPNTTRRYVGLIAEDLDALGLTQFIVYDDDGQPEAISYPLMFIPLLELAKDQQARLDRQQEQIDALTRRLDALDG